MIIDTHVHTFPDAIASKAITKLQRISGITPCTDGTVDGTLSFMNEIGVDKFINLNIATSPTQQTTINNVAAELNKKYQDNYMISFGSVHQSNPDKIAELDLHLEEPEVISVPGIKELPLTLECKVLYAQEQELSRMPENILSRYYPQDVDGSAPGSNREYHIAFYGEIVASYIIE